VPGLLQVGQQVTGAVRGIGQYLTWFGETVVPANTAAPAAASPVPSPVALVRAALVINPVWGSAEICAFNANAVQLRNPRSS